MSDAGQVTADEGGQVGRSPVVQWVPKYPHSLPLSQAPAPQAAPQTLQTDPGTNQARSSVPAGAGALFFTAALLFPWESLWTGKETM